MVKTCRVVYLITELNVGGAENALYQLVIHLNPEKFSPVVCSLGGEGKIAEKLREKGIEVICLGAKNKFDVSVFFKLLNVLRLKKPHILHTYLFHANLAGRIAGRIARVPIVISSVRVSEKDRKHHLYLDMLTQWMVDKEICVSKEVEKFMREKAGISPSKLTTIHNGINPSNFDFPDDVQKDKKRRELSILEFDPVIGTVTRLAKQKGGEYLLKAFQLVLKDYSRSVLLIVGSGPEEKKLKELASRLHIADSTIFLGFREDVLGIINAMDIFVLSSLWEGMPNSILEAYVLGKPVVASKVDGIKELIKNKKTGFMVPAGNHKILAESIKTLIKNPQIREEFGKRGKEFVLENFPLDRMIKDTEKLYEKLLAKQFKNQNGR